MTADELAARLEARQVGGGGRWLARCPAHEDRSPSLSIAAGDEGRVLLRCHAGCDVAAIVGVLGLELADLFPPKPVVTRYAIRNGSGSPVAVHERIDGPDGKRMTWQRPNGGRGLGGIPVVSLPLYGTDRLTSMADRKVVVVEGEKAADALAAAGRLAVATVTGAATIPSDDVLAVLKDREVILWPDADAAGRQHMARIAARLAGVATSVVWLEVPDAHVGDDAADLLAHAPDPQAALREAARHLREVTLEVSSQASVPLTGNLFQTARSLADATPEEVPWRAFPWLADGSITEVDGKAKTAGKTTFAMHLVRAVLNGAPFLGQETVATPIVYLSEQAPTSLRATLARVGLLDRDDLAIMLIRDARGQPWPDLVAASVAECERIGAQMLIVDTLPQFAGLKAEAENDSGAALEAMAPLQAAAERGLAVLLTRHDRKGGGEVGESARGSTAWTGAVDTVINLTRDAGRATVRKMATISRFDAAPEELMIELVDGEYVAHGSEAAYAVALSKVAILALPFDEPMRREAIAQAVAKPEATVRRALDELIVEAVLTRSGDGKRGSPFVFARTSDSFPAPLGREADRKPIRTPSADAASLARAVFGDEISEVTS